MDRSESLHWVQRGAAISFRCHHHVPMELSLDNHANNVELVAYGLLPVAKPAPFFAPFPGASPASPWGAPPRHPCQTHRGMLCGSARDDGECACRSKHKLTWDDTTAACQKQGMRMCSGRKEVRASLGKDDACYSKLRRTHTEAVKSASGRRRRKYPFCCPAEEGAAAAAAPAACEYAENGLTFRLYAQTEKPCDRDLCRYKGKVAARWCEQQGGRLCDLKSEVRPLHGRVVRANECGTACRRTSDLDVPALRCFEGARRDGVDGATGKRSNLYVHKASSRSQLERKHVMCCFGQASPGLGSAGSAAGDKADRKKADRKKADRKAAGKAGLNSVPKDANGAARRLSGATTPPDKEVRRLLTNARARISNALTRLTP